MQLEVDACTGVNPEFVGRVLTVELGVNVTVPAVGEASADGVRRPADLDAIQKRDTTIVSVSCSEGTTRITVQDPVSGKTLARHIDLRDEAPLARPRLLSLSAAELVAASWLELAVPPPVERAPIVEATAPAPLRVEAADAARATTLRRTPALWDIEAVTTGRRWRDSGQWAYGGGLAGAYAHRGWLVVGGDVLFEATSGAVSLGSVRGFLASTSLATRLRHRIGPFGIESGIGVRVGLAHLEGVITGAGKAPPDTHSFTRPWAGPLVNLRLSTRVLPPMIALAEAEAGLVTLETAGRVAGQPEFAIAGPWIAFTLGIGLGSGGNP